MVNLTRLKARSPERIFSQSLPFHERGIERGSQDKGFGMRAVPLYRTYLVSKSLTLPNFPPGVDLVGIEFLEDWFDFI